jgi:hypothetical protein
MGVVERALNPLRRRSFFGIRNLFQRKHKRYPSALLSCNQAPITLKNMKGLASHSGKRIQLANRLHVGVRYYEVVFRRRSRRRCESTQIESMPSTEGVFFESEDEEPLRCDPESPRASSQICKQIAQLRMGLNGVPIFIADVSLGIERIRDAEAQVASVLIAGVKLFRCQVIF